MMWDLRGSGDPSQPQPQPQTVTPNQPYVMQLSGPGPYVVDLRDGVPTQSFPIPQYAGSSSNYPVTNYPGSSYSGQIMPGLVPTTPYIDQNAYSYGYNQTMQYPPPQIQQVSSGGHHSSSRHKHSHSHSHHPSYAHAQSPTRPTPSISYAQIQGPERPSKLSKTYRRGSSRPSRSSYPTLIPPPSPRFQYSKCTGRKKALCIGINYLGQRNELRGCINDAKHMRDFLVRRQGYKEGDIVLLTDDSQNPRELPTRKNMIEAMQWLVAGAKCHDSLFFHYSGHGGQVEDRDGDEIDGWDEVIFPLDFKKNGHILDDELHQLMVLPLPKGCRLTALFDSCHSGTVLDLPYIYSSHGRLRGSHVSNRARARKGTPADVISWSGCMDEQTSADTFADGVAVGAMSHAFVSSLKETPKQTYQELLRSVRLILYPKYSQKPQLGSSHPIDTSLQFIM